MDWVLKMIVSQLTRETRLDHAAFPVDLSVNRAEILSTFIAVGCVWINLMYMSEDELNECLHFLTCIEFFVVCLIPEFIV